MSSLDKFSTFFSVEKLFVRLWLKSNGPLRDERQSHWAQNPIKVDILIPYMLDFSASQEIFHPSRKNPNGCPIAATFYVSHEWTDYGLVQSLYSGASASWIPRRHPVSLSRWETRNPEREEIFRHLDWEIRVSQCLARNQGAIPQTVTRSPRIQSHTASANRFVVIGNEFESRFKISFFSSAKRSGWRRWPVKGKSFQVWKEFATSSYFLPTRRRYWPKMIRLVF